MFSSTTIIFSFITLILSLVLPIVAAIVYCRRYRVAATIVLLGVLTFFLFQLVLRIPLLSTFSRIYPGQLAVYKGWPLLYYSLFLAATAALFEEGGRYLIFRLFLKGRERLNNAVAFGIGHGGFEAISLVGITYIFNIAVMLIMNSGKGETISGAESLLTSGALTLLNYPSYVFLLAGFERLLAMICHIGFSVLVVLGIARKQFRFVIYAFLAHMLLNLPIGFLQTIPGGIWWTMAYITLFALGIFVWLNKFASGMFQLSERKEDSHA